jgi:XTP/dITP diphosphohydrolase
VKTILASRNQGKLREFRALLEGSGLELLPLSERPEIGELKEEGETFLENARSKAWTVTRLTGLPALADDSGLAVEALSGRPGVYSARYAGEGADDQDNFLKLLKELEPVPAEDRQAAFICCLVLALPDGRELAAEGRLEGLISLEPRGERGFGYDPVFYLPDRRATVAEIGAEEKNKISHRARAAAKLKEELNHLGLARGGGKC